MSGLLSILQNENPLLDQRNAELLLDTNDVTSQYGLRLTQQDVVTLLGTRTAALRDSGRIETGPGIIDRLILAFCDSPYLNEENYVDTICALTELFYYMKNETLDQMTDDELIDRMRHYFDGSTGGSLDLLANRELEEMARNIRAFGTEYAPEEEPEKPVTIDDSGDYEIEEDGKWRTVHL